jgi:hypothetical protein
MEISMCNFRMLARRPLRLPNNMNGSGPISDYIKFILSKHWQILL